MAITSEIIGKLGGAGVEATPVSGTASNNDTPTLANIEIPAGENVARVRCGDYHRRSRDRGELGGSRSRKRICKI